MVKRLTIAAVVAVILLAAGLRFIGIGWGLPNSLHCYSYHPDENMVFASAVNMFLKGSIDPGFYNYGSLFLYLVTFAITFTTGWGLAALPRGDLYAHPEALSALYMSGRVVAVLLGIATVLLVYLLAKRLYGRGPALLGALFLAIMPLHVMHSRFLAVDVPATFFVALSLLFAVRLYETRSWRDYLLAGLFAGLAAGTKYNAGLVVVSMIAAHVLLWLQSQHASEAKVRLVDAKLLGAIGTTIAGFLIGTPGVLLNYAKFSQDFSYEVMHARTGHGLVFVNTGSGYLYHLTHSLWAGMSLPLLLIALAGAVYAFYRRSPGDLILLSFLVIYYGVIGAAQVRFARYTIPILPVLAILAARVSVDMIAQWLKSSRRNRRALGYAAGALVAVVSLYALSFTMHLNSLFTQRDTRDSAAEWIMKYVPHGSSIAFPTVPWFYTPPLDPAMALPVTAEGRYEKAMQVKDYRLVVSPPGTEWDLSFLKAQTPEYVVLSQFEYEARERIGDPSVKAYFAYLRDRYYYAPSPFADPPFQRALIRAFFVRELPEDMSYASPTILIYSRKQEVKTGG